MNYHQLKNYVLEQSHNYYDLHTQSIFDAEWDKAYEQLEKIENKFPPITKRLIEIES